MIKGLEKVLLLLGAMLVMALAFGGCGDGTLDEDPTDQLPNGGAIDESRCKDACDKIGACISGSDASSFIDDCRQSCGQSGYFDTEALLCIEAATCDDVFGCGFEY